MLKAPRGPSSRGRVQGLLGGGGGGEEGTGDDGAGDGRCGADEDGGRAFAPVAPGLRNGSLAAIGPLGRSRPCSRR